MKSVVLIRSARSSGHIRASLEKGAGLLAIALLSTAGCSVNVSRTDGESPWSMPRSEREVLFWRTDTSRHPAAAHDLGSGAPVTDDPPRETLLDPFSGAAQQSPLDTSTVVGDVQTTHRYATELEHERQVKARSVERLRNFASYYGALLHLPNEPMFWHDVAQCETDR